MQPFPEQNDKRPIWRSTLSGPTKPSWVIYCVCVNGGSRYHNLMTLQTKHMQKSQVSSKVSAEKRIVYFVIHVVQQWTTMTNLGIPKIVKSYDLQKETKPNFNQSPRPNVTNLVTS